MSGDRLRVGFDCGPLLDPPTGVGRYTAELADALEESGVEVRRFAVALGGRSVPGVKRMRLPARVAQAGWKRYGLPSIQRLTGQVDVLHGTNFVLPPSDRCPGVVTIHDLSFFRDDVFPGGHRLRELVPWSIARAARVITPTRAIADEVAERFDVASEKISVTHEGVDSRFFGATPLADTVLGRMGIAGPYIVAVGTLEPRKNLARLLKAWTAIRNDLEGWSLVLAGPKGWGPELPETPGVVLTGWVGDETLPGLYAGAEVFCYPSLYEGFGLPPLEAMAAGIPVVAGRYTAASEVLGDAAVLVDPADVDGLADGLRALAADAGRRRALQVAGRARAAGFTWQATAKATISAYLDVIRDGERFTRR